ncbi:MAG TPA: GNAT family N-acetyltransferase [Gaiellaceae bacterium]|nr:GNAT family N-acetyltransferase [Gaiellaceae bacterium]
MSRADRDRAIAFMRSHERALADQVVALAWGEAFLTPSLPRVHDGSFVRVDTLPAGVGVPELAREAEQLLGGLRISHRRVNVDDEATAARLSAPFVGAGWEHEQFLVMARRREPDRPAGVHAEEIDPARLRPMDEASIRNWGADDDLVAQILARADRLRRVIDVRAFAVLVGGAPVSRAYLYRDPGNPAIAQVEEVGTLAAHRDRGYARAAVTAAAEAATDAGLVFLVTSAADWPQHLYRRLGFDTVGTEDRFLRR